MGFPRNIDLSNSIDYNILGTCQFNRRDIQIENMIDGPSFVAINGKSTKDPNKMNQFYILTDIPKEILDTYKKIHLDIDIMFMHVVLLPREIITGMKLRVPKYKIGQYVKSRTKTINDTGEEQSVDSLYLGPTNNVSVHIVLNNQ